MFQADSRNIVDKLTRLLPERTNIPFYPRTCTRKPRSTMLLETYLRREFDDRV